MDERFYPQFLDNWDNVRFRKYLDRHVSHHTRLLDYGAGRGALLQLNFRDAVSLAAGTDPDAAVLTNPHLHDARVLPLPSGAIPYDAASFDVVFSANVMEHVPDPHQVMREVYRVLRPGGYFISKTPNSSHYVPLIARVTPHRFHEFINRLRGREAHDTFPTLYRCNSCSAVRRFAALSGFLVRDIQVWEGRPEYLRMHPLLYLFGIAYERTVNFLPWLSRFGAVLVFTLQKPSAEIAAPGTQL